MRLTRCHPPLPLLRALEAYFGCEVTAASFYEADPTLGRAPLSWAKGDRVVLPRGLFAPLRPEGVFLLAHEVCHLRQQAEHASLKPWIVWPVAGVLYAAFREIMKAIVRAKESK